MVAGKVKQAMGLQKSGTNTKPKPDPSTPKAPLSSSTTSSAKQHPQKGSRSFGVFPRASAQVLPRPPDIAELLRLVEELRERESLFKTELLQQKLLRESVSIVPILEAEISKKDSEIQQSRKKIECLEEENEMLRQQIEVLHSEFSNQNRKYEDKIRAMQAELSDIKESFQAEREIEKEQELQEASSSSSNHLKLVDVTNNYKSSTTKCLRKCVTHYPVVVNYGENGTLNVKKSESEKSKSEVKQEDIGIVIHHSDESAELVDLKSRAPRVPKPPPKPSASLPLLPEVSNIPPPPPPPKTVKVRSPPPPPPPPPVKAAAPTPPLPTRVGSAPPTPPPLPPRKSTAAAPAPPPPPPPPAKGSKPAQVKVKRIPEVVEFYHSLMRRDSNPRRDGGGGCGSAADVAAAGTTAKDMIGEIENRSAHLLAIKTDVETQGDFIRFLINEVEGAAFTRIEDVVPFVKWLDDELSYLVDERAVLKHFDWPEQKADALREAAFGYCDLTKLEHEVSSFRDDPRQPCATALKKMQGLFEKLEHGAYNLSRMRESATMRYKVFQIPTDWMLDTGYLSQIKLASVKLAMKYMKRVSAELEIVGTGPEEEDLIVQGVKFAFRVHQFAGGFDVETMSAFQELRDKAQSCNVQCQNQQQKIVCRSSTAC